MNTCKFVILNGFDRCGSSAISKTLSIHPGIELIMQPFNSGFMRKTLYQPIEKREQIKEGEVFFDALSNNVLRNDLIHSHWHKESSTTQKYIPGKIHLIKTTINHFAQRWMLNVYPQIDVWGIWRDPFNIFHSIQRNQFHDHWYKNGLIELRPTVEKEEILSREFLVFFTGKISPNLELALLIAIRSYFFFYYLPKANLINYEVFREHANSSLESFLKKYKLADFDFNSSSKGDLNLVGKKFDPSVRHELDQEIHEEIEPVFQPLLDLFQKKFLI